MRKVEVLPTRDCEAGYGNGQKSIEKGISQGNSGFWTPNKAATLTSNILL